MTRFQIKVLWLRGSKWYKQLVIRLVWNSILYQLDENNVYRKINQVTGKEEFSTQQVHGIA